MTASAAAGTPVVLQTTRGPARGWARAGAYLRLTKPRVVELLLVATVPSMVLAEGGWPDTALVIAVVIGGALAAGGANTINCWIERDRDVLMRRTASRPLPSGELVPSHALTFGVALNVVAFAILALNANLLSAVLTLSATVFYVFVYTIWLKPRTEQNIVIGGAAGAVPVLVGWAAVTGRVDAPAWVLFTVVFLWTPAHFWALAIKYKDDYARGGFPMLPVRRSLRYTTIQIMIYAFLTAIATLCLGLTITVGWIYVATATLLGGMFAARALALVRRPSPEKAIQFFTMSNVYLMLVFVAVAVDTLVR